MKERQRSDRESGVSIISNFYQGVSGLQANSISMEVVGNNIANINTVGFKASRANFQEMINRQIMGGAGRVGAGVQVGGVQQSFTQGAFLTTGSPTDLAIGGDGFFMVNGRAFGSQGNFFTRAGQFTLDNQGYLGTNGLRLQGYLASPNGELSNKIGSLRIPTDSLPPTPTSEIDLRLSLHNAAEIQGDAFDPANPNETSNFSTTVTVYDTQGASRTLQVYVRKTADNEWSYHVAAEPADLGQEGEDLIEIGGGTLTFNTDGKLQTVAGDPVAVTFGSAGEQTIALDFGESLDAGGNGADATAQIENDNSQALFVEQNGRATGALQGTRVENDGRVIGSYSNGEEVILGQVVLARFQANEGLDNLGGNIFKATGRSGEPLLGEPNGGGRGSVFGGNLEQSNVDLAAEFVRLITAQRGYQANARTITTADEVYAETVNLK
jgi:flagellar hook protein FlgE